MKKFLPIIIIVSCLALCCGAFFLYVDGLKNPSYVEISQEELVAFQQVKNTLYPQYIVSALPYPVTPANLTVHSGSAILIDAATGSILYEKNADAIIPPASMTKLA